MRKFLVSFMVMLIPLSYASAQCNYTVNLYDSWGDGWNGNTIDIEVAGTVTNYTLSTGSTTAISVSVNSGDSIKTSFQGGGLFAAECSYDVVDASGNTLYTSPNGGAMTPGAVQFADTAGCPAILPCPDPTGFAAHNITSTTAGITFNVGTGASRIVEWGPTGFTAGTGTIVTSTTDTVDLSGLPPGTCIDVYIQGDCSASGDGVSSVQGPFQLCAAYVPDWIEDFNDHGTFSTWPPDGWMEMENPVGDTLILSATGWTYDSYANQSGGSPTAKENIYGTGDPNAWLVGPAVDLGTGNTYNLEYDAAWTEWGNTSDAIIGSDDTVHIAISRDGGNTFLRSDILVSYHQGNPINAAGIHGVHTLNIDGVVHVGVMTTSTVSNEDTDFFIDNIEIRTPPTCQEPFGFAAINTTADSVYFGFTADTSAVGYAIEWGPCGFAQGAGMTDTIASDTTGVGGLMPNTCYEFYVMTLCGSSTSMWSGPYDVRTACSVYLSAPYTENFTLSSYGPANSTTLSFENCWTVGSSGAMRWESEDASGANENSIETGPHYDATTPSTVGGGYMFVETSSAGNPAELYSPSIEMSALTTPTLSFAYHMYGATMGTLSVDVWNGSIWVDNVWTLSGQQQTAGNDPWLTAQVPLAAFAGDTIQIRFRGTRTTSYTSDMSIDDVTVANGPNCSVVSGGFAENITSSAADLNWSAFTSSNYDIEWGPCGFTPGTGIGTVVTGVNPGYTLSGLQPNTCYEFYVTNNCDPNGTQYGPYSFLTLCSAMLNGTYTVGGTPGPNNFADLDSVEATLVCGISGPVTFQLMGTDTLTNAFEIFGDVMGISSTNTITFDGMGQTGTIIMNGTGPIFDLVDTRHITFQDLVMIDSSAAGLGIRMINDVDSITISGNHIIAGPGATSSLTAGIAVTATNTSLSSAGSDANHIVVDNNIIDGGYYGFTAYGVNTTTTVDDITVTNNTFTNQYYYGVRIYYYNNVNVSNNVISGLRNTFNYGMYMYYNQNMDIIANDVEAITYALYMPAANRYDTTAVTNITNNMFKGVGSTTNSAVYSTTSSQNINFYHNSINSNGYGWRDFGTTNIDVRNNIFVGGNLPIDLSTTPDSAVDVIDNNVYYNTTGGNIGELGSAYANLAAMQAGLTWANQNSLEGDPIFLSPTDLHLTGALANDAGDNSVGITVDIDGDARPASGATTVDIGADEYTPLVWDAEATALFEPEAGGCGDSTVAVSVIVRNLGLNDITTITVNADVTGAVTANLSTTFNGLIPSTESDTISVGTFNIYTGGTVTVSGNVVLANDGDNSNDSTASRTLDYISFEPQAMPTDTVCEGSNIDLYAMTQSGVIHGWYANQADTVPVSTGDTLSVVADPAQTTYYLGYITSGLDSIETTFAANNGCGAGNMFDLALSKAIIMEGLTVHCATGAGSTETFDIYYVSGSYVGNETNQAAWTLHESVTVTSNGNGIPTPLEFTTPLTLPAGTYGIYVDGDVLYTNGSQVFSNADMTITTGAGICTSFSSPINGRIWNGRIIYRASNACSQDKIAVTYGTHPAPTAAFTSSYTGGNGSGLYDFDASASADADSLYWMFGDVAGSTANGVNTSFTYADNGQYTVTLIAFNDCGSDTITDTVSVEGIGLNELAGLRDIRLFPNPSTGNVNVLIDLSNAQDLTLEVINLQGQTLYTEGLGRVEGEYIWTADLSELPKGAYFVRLIGGQGIKNIPLTLH